ncbi:hypothetical protein PBRA_009115 [Plasmodiophora brassicae]|uniref:Uncharacterized protein n=1 Tax=Plasmodiophora brassicae TaxID=37360 RepID=A0A0G4J5F1_PLABS|nr:hypothetical protein PBRA_009115 [Plasmodiophora brassicae]
MAAIRDQPDGTLVYNPTWPVHVSAIQVDHQRPRPIAPLSARVLPNVKQGVCFYDKSSYGAPTQSRPSTTLTSMHSNHPAMFAVRFLPVAPVESRRCAVPGRRPDPECIHVTDAANRRRRTSPHVQRLSRCPQRLFRSASLAGIPTRTHARHRRTVTERRCMYSSEHPVVVPLA